MTTSAQQRFRLLDLPAELRNRIYHYALVLASGRMRISPAFRPPPLLLTSKQVREEALGIWYMNNTFLIIIQDCDCAPFRAFDRNLRKSGLHKKFFKAGRFEVTFVGVKWERLMEWCHFVWDGKVAMIRSTTEPRRVESVVDIALTIAAVARHSSTSWALCEIQLESLRRVAGLLDPKWLK